MSRIGLCLLMLAVTGCTPAQATSNTPNVWPPTAVSMVGPCLKIAVAVASGGVDDAKVSAGNVAAAAPPLGSAALRIGTVAAQLASATVLRDAREQFDRLGDARSSRPWTAATLRCLARKSPPAVRPDESG